LILFNNLHRTVALVVATVLLQACTALGLQDADQFHERVAVALSSISAARDAAGAALDAGAITPDAAARIQRHADDARLAVDLVLVMHATEPARATVELGAIETDVRALSDELPPDAPVPP
jgi:hypothetical protein